MAVKWIVWLRLPVPTKQTNSSHMQFLRATFDVFDLCFQGWQTAESTKEAQQNNNNMEGLSGEGTKLEFL